MAAGQVGVTGQHSKSLHCVGRGLDLGHDHGPGRFHSIKKALAATAAISIILCVAACDKPKEASTEVIPVPLITARIDDPVDLARITGDIEARYNTQLSFRVSGQIVARLVDYGSTVKKGEELARLDGRQQTASLEAAKANVAAAEAQVAQKRAENGRQQELQKLGFTTAAKVDNVYAALVAAESDLKIANENLQTAQNEFSYTILRAPESGVITNVIADVGQVVGPGRPIVQLATVDRKEAVFNVGDRALAFQIHDPKVQISLVSDASVVATGVVREIAPSADPTTATFTVKVALDNPPAAMTLGAPVIGAVSFVGAPRISLPPMAIDQKDGKPAVWVVDPVTSTVQMRPVQIYRYDSDRILVSDGLKAGDVIVADGIQRLYTGLKVVNISAGPLGGS